MKTLKFTILSVALFSLVSCNKDNKLPLDIPTEYISDDYDDNTSTEKGIRSSLSAFAGYIRKGDNAANKLALDSLNKYFSVLGTPTLKSITPVYYSNLIENTWFPNLVASSQNVFDITDAPTASIGGVFVNRLLDSKGKEMLQEIEKGMFMATLYNHFVNLASGTLTSATVDKMVCIYGAHPNFPNTNTLANTSTPDAYIALYTSRRDRTANATGLYRDIKGQFLKLKAAVEAGNDYKKEQNEAISSLKLLMEKAILATIINYANSARVKIDKESPTDADKVGAIHDLSECLGFIHGFKAVAQANRKISDTQIEQIMEYLKSPIDGESEMYLFATSPAESVNSLVELRNYIKGIYNFTDSEMNDFNFNWINSEGR